MRAFANKTAVFEHLKKKFAKGSKLIIVKGSTVTKPVRRFSDFDVEVWCKKPRKPYYEIAFVRAKAILISAYFYRYKEGKQAQTPPNTKILHGKYNSKIRTYFSKESYTPRQITTRECHLVADFMFKYMRSKDKEYLNAVQKRIKGQN